MGQHFTGDQACSCVVMRTEELNVSSGKEVEKQLLLVRDLRLSHLCF
jgi:hypothetical protein